ncbi:SAM-dependent methyltransferase [Amycolatopsis sp. NPDC004368]
MIEPGVSATALLIAAARAVETHRPDGLVHDEWAERFVHAAASDLPTHIEDVELGDADPFWDRGGGYFALRTRVFDDFVLSASRTARQVVLLGSGLDTRAWRLDLPARTRFFEVDRAEVFDFKRRVLDHKSPVEHHFLAVDLADDWGRALLGAGFSPDLPTAWVIEGVLYYLPGTVETLLMTTIDELSAPGSEIAYETFPRPDAEARSHEMYAATANTAGYDVGGLLDTGVRPDSAAALRTAGWQVTSDRGVDFTPRYGRGPDPAVDDPIAGFRWFFGRKSGGPS